MEKTNTARAAYTRYYLTRPDAGPHSRMVEVLVTGDSVTVYASEPTPDRKGSAFSVLARTDRDGGRKIWREHVAQGYRCTESVAG